MRNRTDVEYFCSRATLSCVVSEAAGATTAGWVAGLYFRSTEWLDGIFISTALLRDAFDATYASPKKRRQVRKERKKKWTSVLIYG